MRVLCDHGADPNEELGFALALDLAVARELLEQGAAPTRALVAKVEAFAEHGETPEVVALLLEYGADTHTALELALAKDVFHRLDGTIVLLRRAFSQC